MNNEEKILGILEQMQSTMGQMNGRLDRLESDITTVKADMATFKEDLTFTKETAMRMELEHGEQLKGLWDSQKSIEHTLKDHTARLTRVERKIDDLDIRVSVHDIKLSASN